MVVLDLRQKPQNNEKETFLEEQSLQVTPKKNFLKSWKFYIIFTILVSIIVTGVIFFLPKNKIYKNQKYNFSFSYPFNWLKEDLSKNGLDKYLTVRVKESKTNSNFQVKINELSSSVNLELNKLIEELDKKMSQELKDFDKISSQSIKIDDKDAIEYVYKYSYQNEKGETKKAQQKMIIVLVSNKVFYLTGYSSQENFSDFDPRFEKIIKSFKIN